MSNVASLTFSKVVSATRDFGDLNLYLSHFVVGGTSLRRRMLSVNVKRVALNVALMIVLVS